MFFYISACVEEQIQPSREIIVEGNKIGIRSDGPINIQIIKEKVSERDQIPIDQILTCYYFGQTSQGYWEYHLTTFYNGPKIYTVTQIIGDTTEGF